MSRMLAGGRLVVIRPMIFRLSGSMIGLETRATRPPAWTLRMGEPTKRLL